MEEFTMEQFLAERENEQSNNDIEVAELPRDEQEQATSDEYSMEQFLKEKEAEETPESITQEFSLENDEKILQEYEDSQPTILEGIGALLSGTLKENTAPGDKRSAWEKFKYDYNEQVGQRIRDEWGIDDERSNEGSFFQPDFVTGPDNKRTMTGNKNYNNMNQEQADAFERKLKREVGDETYYKLINNMHNLEKGGFTEDERGVLGRWGKDPHFQAFWRVKEENKMKNAKLLERMKLGRKDTLRNQAFPYGKGKEGKQYLGSSTTEITYAPGHEKYIKPGEELFGSNKTGTEQTPIEGKAAEATSEILTDEQKDIAVQVRNMDYINPENHATVPGIDNDKFFGEKVWNETTKANVANLNDEDFMEVASTIDNPKDFIEATKLRNEAEGSSGSMTEDEMITMKPFQEVALKLNGKVFDLGREGSNHEKIANNLLGKMSGNNWSLLRLGANVTDVWNEPENAGNLADALEMYETTKVGVDQIARGSVNTLVDIAATFGLAIPEKIVQTMGSAAAKKLIHQKIIGQLRKIATGSVTKKQMVSGAAFGAAEGALDDLGNQTIRMEGNRQESLNKTQLALSTIGGAALGPALIGTIRGAGHLWSKSQEPKKRIAETLINIDTKIDKAIGIAGNKNLTRTERRQARKEIIRMKKLKSKVSALKPNKQRDEFLNDESAIMDDFLKEMQAYDKSPDAHPALKRIYEDENLKNMKDTASKEELDEVNKKYEEKIDATRDENVIVKPEKTQLNSKDSDGNKIVQTDRDLKQQHNEEQNWEYSVDEPSVKRQKERKEGQHSDEITIRDEENNAIKALRTHPTDKDGNTKYSFIDEKEKKVVHVELDSDGQVTRQLDTPTDRTKMSEEAITEEENWLKNSLKLEKNTPEDFPDADLPDRQKNITISRFFDARGRKYGFDDWINSVQSTSDKGAQLKQENRNVPINNRKDFKDELDRRMAQYDRKIENLKATGHEQANVSKSRKKMEKSEAQLAANRLYHYSEQVKALYVKNKDNPKIKEFARNHYNDIKKKRIVDKKKFQEDYDKADAEYYNQFDIDKSTSKFQEDRQENLHNEYGKQYDIRNDQDEYFSVDRNKADEVENDKKMVDLIEQKIAEGKNDAIDSYNHIKLIEQQHGRKWNGDVNEDILKRYGLDAKKIQDFRDRKLQLETFKSKENNTKKIMESQELRHYEHERLLKNLSNADTSRIETVDELKNIVDTMAKDFVDLGTGRGGKLISPTTKQDIQKKIDMLNASIKELSENSNGNNKDQLEALRKKIWGLKKQLNKNSSKKKTKDENLNQKEKQAKEKKERNDKANEAAEREKSEIRHKQIVKKVSYHQRNKNKPGYEEQRSLNNAEKTGKKLLTERQQKLADRGYISAELIANMSEPKNKDGSFMTAKERELGRIEAEYVAFNEEVIAMQKEMGITPNKRTENGKYEGTSIYGAPSKVKFRESIADVSNSAAQTISTLWGNRKIAGKSKLGKDSTDGRSEIGAFMKKDFTDEELKNLGIDKNMSQKDQDAAWKEAVKPLFMTEQYGQMQKGLINTLMNDFQWSKEFATKFETSYSQAVDKVYPQIAEFRKAIYSLLNQKDFNGKIDYTLPNNFNVKFDVTKVDKHTWKIAGKEGEVLIKTNDVNELSRALVPNIIHSIDGYVADQLRRKGWDSNHDAFRFDPTKETDQDLLNAYLNIMADLNEKDILGNILKDNGFTGRMPSIRPGNKLTREDIMASKEALSLEHAAGEEVKVDAREMSVSHMVSKDQVMRDYMASSSHIQIATDSIVDKMAIDAGLFTNTKPLPSDGPFERMIVLAQHTSKYDKSQAIKPPKGVDEVQWYKTQEEIFNESRAKLENNPDLRGSLDGKELLGGERIFFDNNGKMIGNNTKTKQELITQERKRGTKIRELRRKVLTAQQEKELDRIGKNYETLAKRVKGWSSNKQLTPIEREAKNIVSQAERPPAKLDTQPSMHNDVDIVQVEKTAINERKYNTDNEFVAYIKRQYGMSDFYKDFNELHSSKTSAERMNARFKENLRTRLEKDIPVEVREDMVNFIIKSDYKVLDHLSKADADEIMIRHKDFIKEHKKALDQMSEAIATPEKQYGHYYNSPEAYVAEMRLPEEMVRVIDQIVSIKAMTDDGWKFVEKNKNEQWFKDVIAMRKNDEVRSRELFSDNPENIVKGWVAEDYQAGKYIDENGDIKFDAQDKIEYGAIGLDLENTKVGTRLDEAEEKGFRNIDKSKYDTYTHTLPDGTTVEYIKVTENSLDQAKKDKLKITGKSPRAIAGTKIREKLGRSNDLIDILTETSSSIMAKETRRTITQQTLSGKYGLIFSDSQKPGMVRLTDEETASLPFEMRGKVNFVHKGFKRQILGGKQARIFGINNESKQWIKVIDRMWTDSITRLKQDVVLKNPSSYKTAFVYNYVNAMMIGVNPINAAKWTKQAMKESAINNKLSERFAYHQAKGDIAKANRVKDRLLQSELYQMEIMGLSTNVIDGVKGTSDINTRLASNIFKSDNADTLTNFIMINQNSSIGKISTKTFSSIDTTGRFMAAKQFEKDGMNRPDAILKANGLFADMEQIAPVWVDVADRYGLIPFAKWWTQTAPQIIKTIGYKPHFSIPVMIGVYELSRASEEHGESKRKGNSDVNWFSHNLSGTNPMETTADFIEGGIFGQWEDLYYGIKNDGPLRAIVRKMGPQVLPSIYMKPINHWLTEKAKEEAGKKSAFKNFWEKELKSQIVPNRGHDYSEDRTKPMPDTAAFTQGIIEQIFPDSEVNRNFRKTHSYSRSRNNRNRPSRPSRPKRN